MRALALLALLGAAAPASASPTRDYWPTDEWRTRPPRPGQADRLAPFEAYAFAPPPADRSGIRTDGVVVIEGGYLVYERYANGYDAGKRHYAWSMTKSLINALVGTAEKAGLIHRGDRVADLDARYDRARHPALTVEHLLQMSSGLDWNEGYEYTPVHSTVIAMLYTAGFRDMASYVYNLAEAHPPGSFWHYSSGDTNLLAALLKAKLAPDAYAAYPWTAIFEPLGIKSAVVERDGAGTFVGGSYWYATPRDFARFGMLFLDGGRWQGKALLPDDWVAWSTRLPAAFFTTPAGEFEHSHQAALWWVNLGDPARNLPAPWPSAPADTFAALGHWGQSIFVIPSRDLVIVRTADDRDRSFKANRFLELLLAGLKS